MGEVFNCVGNTLSGFVLGISILRGWLRKCGEESKLQNWVITPKHVSLTRLTPVIKPRCYSRNILPRLYNIHSDKEYKEILASSNLHLNFINFLYTRVNKTCMAA